ncbi:IPT/TIG domain-containing protein [Jatrophihabitans fulvus]
MTRIHPSRRLVAAGGAVLVGAGALTAGVLTVAGPANAAATMTITSLSVHRLPALTAKQSIVVTGTNFDEDSINDVTVAGCTAGIYAVTSPTTLIFKTDNTCAVGNNVVVTIDPVTGSNVVTTPSTNTKQALAFVAAPTLADNDGTTFPVVTAGSAGQTAPKTSASSGGGTAIKVTAGSTPFVNSTTYPLSATLDGVKLTGVTMASGGGSFTATLPAIPADAAPVLRVTSNGVSKSFAYAAASSSTTVADSHAFQIAGISIKVGSASGPMDGGNKLAVTGTGFTTSTTVTVDGNSCPVVAGSVKATTVTCTVPAATAEGPVTVQTTTGSVTSTVSAGSTYTYVR